MGLYINPPSMEKESFLVEYATPLNAPPKEFNFKESEHLPVCWMYNGNFTAVGIATSMRELQAFSVPSDARPKRWFLVKKSDLGMKAGLPEGLVNSAVKEG